MLYGIILGISIIVGSLFGKFWIGIIVGLTVNLFLFLVLKYGSVIRERLASLRTTAPNLLITTKSTSLKAWKWKWFILIPAIILLIATYQGRVMLEKAFLNAFAAISGGEYVEYQFTTLEPQEFVAPAPGRWRFEVIDQKEYRYKCPGWKGERSGYLKEVRGRQVMYAQPLNEYPFQEEGYPGALLIYSEVSKENPRPSNQEFIIGENKKYFIGPNLTREEKRCDIAIPAPVKFVLHRVE